MVTTRTDKPKEVCPQCGPSCSYHQPEQADEATVCIGCHKTGIVRHPHPDNPTTIERCPVHYRECVEPQADTKHCTKCGKPFTDGKYGAAWPDGGGLFQHTECPPVDTSLQLLVIDLGESCVVRIESGEPKLWAIQAFESMVPVGYNMTPIVHVPHSFAAVREAIDGEKPVPRIERTPAGSCLDYRLVLHDDNNLVCPERSIGMTHADLQGLTTFVRGRSLAGHPLPIYEGGKWERLPSTVEHMGDPLESIGIAVWRYTR